MSKDINFGLTSGDYASHRAGFPDSLFARLLEYGIGLPHQDIVDLGTGTGTLARGFAQRGGNVTAIDPSEEMLAQAKKLDAEAEVNIDYKIATAEDTGLEDNFADVVTAGQCWHWFDGKLAAEEVSRILRAGGKMAIAHFDWLPLEGSLVAATETLIQKHNPKWDMGGGDGKYPQWQSDLEGAGFENIETFSYEEAQPYTPEAWRGRIRASAGVGASLPPEGVAAFDSELKALIAQKFPGEILQMPHLVWAMLGNKK